MSKWDKLIARICAMPSDIRFNELKKVLEHYEYLMTKPRGGSSHCTFRKKEKCQLQFPRMNQ